MTLRRQLTEALEEGHRVRERLRQKETVADLVTDRLATLEAQNEKLRRVVRVLVKRLQGKEART